MTARERARQRLERCAPAFEHWERRQPTTRLGDRVEAHPEREREIVGSVIRGREELVTRAAPGAHAGPNAPLLMRLVRHPFVLVPVSPVRVRVIAEVREPLAPPARPDPRNDMRELRADLRHRSPIRAHPHRPEPRPRPFARVRALNEEGTP